MITRSVAKAREESVGSLASILLSEENRHTVRIIVQNRVTVLGLSIILIWLVVAVIGPAVAPYAYDEHAMAERLQSPNAKHWLGTDWLGRDIFSRLLCGANITLLWGLMPIGIAMLIGIPTGAIAGYYGGWLGGFIMRLADLFLSVPRLLLAVAITAALGPSLFNALFAISLTWWPWYTRLVQAETLALKERIFIEAVQGLGATNVHVLVRHILPNCLSTILVRGSVDLGFSVLYMASLGFIGMGAQPPSPEWGLMVSSGRSYMPEYWWISLFPGLAIFTIVFGFNVVGDGIRDAFDPEIRGR